jgi:protocatechuate 3,4-dioxygenase beta subunit
MNKFLVLLVLVFGMSACGATPTPTEVSPQTPAQTAAAPEATETEAVVVSTIPVPDDFFTQSGISLPEPTCNGLTQPQTEGPYYKADTPERNSLMEEGMEGTRLILVGYVLDQNCNPLPNAWLDFWQADASGEYDNEGYRLRGHQFTDAQGRYYLETVLPGLYSSRPIEHIHVKVQPQGGEVVTSQLYFPVRPVEGLTVDLEDRGDTVVGYFNFVVQR